MKLNPEEEIPIEIYRAFALTKPTEFDAYVRKWREEHPEPEHPVIVTQVFEDKAEVCEPITEKQSTRKRKSKAENEVTIETEEALEDVGSRSG